MTSAANPHDSGTAAADQPVELATYLTVPEVARVLRLGVWATAQLCRDGEIRATKPGKQWLVTPTDLQAYIDAGRNTAPEAASA